MKRISDKADRKKLENNGEKTRNWENLENKKNVQKSGKNIENKETKQNIKTNIGDVWLSFK